MNAQEKSKRRWGASQVAILFAILTVIGLTAVGAVRVLAFGEKGTRKPDEPITPAPSLSPLEEPPLTYPTASFAQIEGWIVLRIGSELLAIDPRHPDDVVALPGGASGDPVAWSADGSQLIVDEGLGLAVLGGNGRKRTLPRDAEGASFSPDGQSVVYERDGELFVTGAVGGASRLIVATSKPDPCVAPGDCDGSSDPAWSPDGSVIAFIDRTVVKGVYTLPGVHVSRTTISLVRPNGTGRRVLVALGRDDRSALADGTGALAWSPDGSRLVFTSSSGIYVLDADGSRLRRVALQGASPTWSPNGKRIALWVELPSIGRATPVHMIWIIEVADSYLRVLAPEVPLALNRTSLAWNPAV